VWLLAQGKNWLILDPQIIIDHDTDKTPALIEAEWGYMIPSVAGGERLFAAGRWRRFGQALFLEL
jgi:hypothetical protein